MSTALRLALLCALSALVVTTAAGYSPDPRVPLFSYEFEKEAPVNRLAPNLSFESGVLSESLKPTHLGAWSERNLHEKLSRSESSRLIHFDFTVGGLPTTLQFKSEALRMQIDQERKLYYKSGIAYEFRPRHLPTGFIDLAYKGLWKTFTMPLQSLLEKTSDY